jgi:predicted nucleotidyltransferase
MEIKEALINQLQKVVNFLNEHKIGYALAGGLAFSALVEPRATVDIDILIMVKEKEMSGFIDLIKEKFESIIPHKEPMRFNEIQIWRVISFIKDREMIIDFLLAESEFHENVINRAIEIDFYSSKIKIITLEDLILLKKCAKRTQDIADLETISDIFKNEIDQEYVDIWSNNLKII